MNSNQCPSCSNPYSFVNPPKKLKNCTHCICDTCLTTVLKCPIDQKRIDLKRYTAKAFEINHQLLDQIEKVVESPKKVRVPLAKEMSPKKEFQVCLLHSKPADIICYQDGCLICANCALFGEHRGHTIKNCDQFLNSLTSYTEQALEVFDKLKEKQQNLSEEIITQYIDDCFKQQKNQQLKNIKQAFTKLVQKVKKAEKAAILKLDQEISARRTNLLREVSISELEGKKSQWFKEVEKLGTITQDAYEFRNVTEALRYLDSKDSQSFLLKRGEYLFVQYSSSEDLIKSKIDTQTSKLKSIINQEIDLAIDQYCTFAGGPSQRKQSTPCTKLKESNLSRVSKKQEEDILIDESSPRRMLVGEGSRKDLYLDVNMKSEYLLAPKIPEVNIVESVQHCGENIMELANNQKLQRSKSTRPRSITDFNIVSSRQVLGTLQNKKRKKIQIPQKYRAAFQDLKNDRCQVIDFGGAQLGDQNILALCQYIEKTHKLRNLKLVRNKITDDVVKQLLNACFTAKVTSLNLGQNSLTEKSLQMMETFDLGELKNITLSLNKINRRNVKVRLEEFVRRGITLSI